MSKPTVVAPDGGWGWVVVFATFTFQFIIGTVISALSILYIDLQEQFHEGKSITSWIMSVLTTMCYITSPAAPILCAKYGHKTVIFVGGLLTGLGVFISVFANSITFLILSLGFLTGMGDGLCYVSFIIICTMYFNKKRALALGLGISGFGLAMFVVPPVIIRLEDEFTWRGVILIMSGCSFNVCVLALLLRPLKTCNIELDRHRSDNVNVRQNIDENVYVKEEDKSNLTPQWTIDGLDVVALGVCNREEISVTNSNTGTMVMKDNYQTSIHTPTLSSRQSLTNQNSGIKTESEVSSNQDSIMNNIIISVSNKTNKTYCHHFLSSLNVYKNLLTNWKCLVVIVINCVFYLTYITTNLYIVDRAVENGIEKHSAALALSLYGAGDTCGRVFIGLIADRSWVNRLVLYFLCIFLSGLLTCLSVFCGPHLALHIAYGGSYGLFIGGYIILTPVVLVDILGVDMVGQSYGLCTFFQGTSNLFGAPLAGLTFDLTGSYTIPFVLYGMFLILSSLLLFPLIYQSLRGDNQVRK